MLKTSVVISTYNGQKYIIKQLESIKLQTKKPDEVLIFDDCSNDSTVQIVKDYIKRGGKELNNWHIYINKVNKGWRVNFIDGMKKASGDLIFTCDQDDIWSKYKIAQQYDIMSRNNSIDVLASNFLRFNDSENLRILKMKNTKVKFLPWSYKFMNVERPGCTYCIRSSFFKKCLPFWRSTYEHDAFLWRMAFINGGLAISKQQLLYWRTHSDSTYSQERSIYTKEKRINEIMNENNMLDSMIVFSRIYNQNLSKLPKKRVKNYKLLLKLRFNYIKEPNLRHLFSLVFHFNLYGYKKQFLRDISMGNCSK